MKYTVEILETLVRNVTLEADSEQEAIEKVKQSYADGLEVLDWQDCIGADFKIAKDAEDAENIEDV